MLRQEIEELLKDAVEQAQQEKLLPEFALPEIIVEKTENEKFGDYSTNLAMKIAGLVKKSPLEVAEIIADEARDISDETVTIFEKIEAVKPGFINFYFSVAHLQNKIAGILEQGQSYGQLDIGQGQKVQVEFISANPTGPLTLGNGRGGFFGDTMANVLGKAGYNVEREFLINDAGYQAEVLGHSVLADDEAQYKGEYITVLQKELKNSLGQDAKELGYIAAQHILENMIRPTILERMKIKFDVWFSEKNLRESGETEKTIGILKEKNLIYEKEGAVWFKSSEFGDDKDRVLVTSAKAEKKGDSTYLLSDIAYHFDKFVKRNFNKVIDIWGADHHGYVARLQAAKKALDMPGELKIIIMQLVRLFKGGQEVKMSKRAGTYVTLDELLDEIPLDVARFFFLMYSADTHMDFNFDLAKEQSEKNPVYYVQYAYARIHSILAKFQSTNPKFSPYGGSPEGRQINSKAQISNSKLELIKEPAELDLIKQLVRLPEIIEDTAKDYQVQRLPQYALDLVTAFHKFYEECRVIDQNYPDLTQARLGLVEATGIVLKNTLDLMGISAPEKM